MPSAEHARKLVWITPQCGVIRACYLELGGRQQPPRPRRGEIFCFDKLTTSKDLKISPLFGEAWVTDQLQDTTSSPPRLASSYSVLILTCSILLVPGSAAAPRNTLSLLWKLDRWKIGQSIGYYTKSGEQIFSQEGNTNYKIYIHSSQQSWTEFTQMQNSFIIMASYIFLPNNQSSFILYISTSCKFSNARFALYSWTTWKKELKCSPHALSSDYTCKLTNELSVRGEDACGCV